MIKRYDDEGFLTIEPPYSPAEQKVLGGGRKLERGIAQMLHDVITGTDREDDPRLL